ncbi:hypothetical protein OG594_02095 [Streptomyces sp. NBC_01214]|uniref:hypothetical protein n=1 Tax=Streptomyces sp. NBC_01214 TaxID=2903777 RepID=UPI002254455C|nr:hypothetical protein [Streptomyces sp. NBC_01214]MCX4800476.1 hypothetical protein [Streptomyces sp. NBC_01214]
MSAAGDVSPETAALAKNIRTLQSQASVVDGEQARTWVAKVGADDLTVKQPQLSTFGFSWSKLNNCPASAGVSSWTLALIGTACAAACVGTAGAARVPCITAAGGLGAGTVWFCTGKATT